MLYISPLKALAVDVERNLRAPIAGIANRAAARGDLLHAPTVAVRTGDTPAAERARFQREPADILITTPESLYLLLTSNAREALRRIETVIVDEIHALVPTKRGAHLALSLERLAALTAAPPQRIGLSATQRPLDEVARYLGGVEPRIARIGSATIHGTESGTDHADHDPRSGAAARRAGCPSRRTRFTTSSRRTAPPPSTATSPSSTRRRRRNSSCTIEVPVEDMARIGQVEEIPERPRVAGSGAIVDLDGDPSAAAGAGPGAPIDADLREQPPHRRAAGVGTQRARRRAARPRAPRVAGAAAADRDRGPPESGPDSRPRRHLLARARHRHGRDRSRHPDRGAAIGRERDAAHRPLRAHDRSAEPRRHRPQIPRRPRRLRRGDARDARGADRIEPLSAQPARRPRAADRRDGRDGNVGRGCPVRGGPRRGAVRRVEPLDLRRPARHAVRTLPVRRFRGSAAAADVGPLEERGHRARRREARRSRSTAGRFPTAASTACSSPASAARRPASASWTRRWFSRAASAKRSCSAPRRGASRRSPTTRSSSRRHPGNRARCRSGKPTPPAGRSSWDAISASWCAACGRCRPPPRSPG